MPCKLTPWQLYPSKNCPHNCDDEWLCSFTWIASMHELDINRSNWYRFFSIEFFKFYSNIGFHLVFVMIYSRENNQFSDILWNYLWFQLNERNLRFSLLAWNISHVPLRCKQFHLKCFRRFTLLTFKNRSNFTKYGTISTSRFVMDVSVWIIISPAVYLCLKIDSMLTDFSLFKVWFA